MNVNVNSCREINCAWYKKTTDTGVVLKFQSCAPMQRDMNIAKGTVHCFFEGLAYGKILTKL